jgi:hypothetical protein
MMFSDMNQTNQTNGSGDPSETTGD